MMFCFIDPSIPLIWGCSSPFYLVFFKGGEGGGSHSTNTTCAGRVALGTWERERERVEGTIRLFQDKQACKVYCLPNYLAKLRLCGLNSLIWR